MGRLIPAGTGFWWYRHVAIPPDEPPPPPPVVQPSDEDMDLDHMEYLAEPEEALDRGGDEGIYHPYGARPSDPRSVCSGGTLARRIRPVGLRSKRGQTGLRLYTTTRHPTPPLSRAASEDGPLAQRASLPTPSAARERREASPAPGQRAGARWSAGRSGGRRRRMAGSTSRRVAQKPGSVCTRYRASATTPRFRTSATRLDEPASARRTSRGERRMLLSYPHARGPNVAGT
jgi:hypothetical protein